MSLYFTILYNALYFIKKNIIFCLIKLIFFKIYFYKINKSIYDRTDNACEIFHHKLNNLNEIKHPKISYFVEKIKIYTKKKLMI